MIRRLFPFPLIVAMGLTLSGFPVSAKQSIGDGVERALDNIMRVHFYGVKIVDHRRKANWKSLIPDDWDQNTTVKPIVPWTQLDFPLRCQQLTPRSFRDWHRAFTGSREQWESVSGLGNWDTPAFLLTRMSRKYWFFDDLPVLVSMAVIGNSFEIEHILNDRSDQIRRQMLINTYNLRQYRSASVEENYMYQRPLKVLAKRECNGFRIFDLEVRDK